MRLVLVVVSAVVMLAACGGPNRLTQEQVCGPNGCDACIGLNCLGTDAGVDAGSP